MVEGLTAENANNKSKGGVLLGNVSRVSLSDGRSVISQGIPDYTGFYLTMSTSTTCQDRIVRSPEKGKQMGARSTVRRR